MPPRDVRKLLFDIQQAGELISSFVHAKTFEHYLSDPMLRSAVERQFEVIGEALRQAIEIAPDLESDITSARRIIDFRNRLIHGYAEVSAPVVWGITVDRLPALLGEVQRLLNRE